MITEIMILTYLTTRHAASKALRRVHVDERGEGVISTAIAVLVLAFLGAAMWVAFNRMFNDTTDKTENQVDQIGR